MSKEKIRRPSLFYTDSDYLQFLVGQKGGHPEFGSRREHRLLNADYDKVGDEIHRLCDQKKKLQVENANRDELKKRMADMDLDLWLILTFLC